jgi:hypothetical protein
MEDKVRSLVGLLVHGYLVPSTNIDGRIITIGRNVNNIVDAMRRISYQRVHPALFLRISLCFKDISTLEQLPFDLRSKPGIAEKKRLCK